MYILPTYNNVTGQCTVQALKLLNYDLHDRGALFRSTSHNFNGQNGAIDQPIYISLPTKGYSLKFFFILKLLKTLPLSWGGEISKSFFVFYIL